MLFRNERKESQEDTIIIVCQQKVKSPLELLTVTRDPTAAFHQDKGVRVLTIVHLLRMTDLERKPLVEPPVETKALAAWLARAVTSTPFLNQTDNALKKMLSQSRANSNAPS